MATDRPPGPGVRRRAALFGILVCTPLVPAFAQAEGIGFVETLRGQAFAESGRQRRALSLQAPLFVGDLIVTGTAARIALRLGKRTRLSLGENARLRIDRHILANDNGDYELQAGPLFVDHDDNGPAIPATVRSPYALIAVRGTRFFCGPSNGVFGVFVEAGRVSVQAARRSVLLSMGDGTNIARPGDPPSSVIKWGEGRIRAALAGVR